MPFGSGIRTQGVRPPSVRRDSLLRMSDLIILCRIQSATPGGSGNERLAMLAAPKDSKKETPPGASGAEGRQGGLAIKKGAKTLFEARSGVKIEVLRPRKAIW